MTSVLKRVLNREIRGQLPFAGRSVTTATDDTTKFLLPPIGTNWARAFDPNTSNSVSHLRRAIRPIARLSGL